MNRKQWILSIGGAVVSAAVSSGITYLVVSKKLGADFDRRLEEELDMNFKIWDEDRNAEIPDDEEYPEDVVELTTSKEFAEEMYTFDEEDPDDQDDDESVEDEGVQEALERARQLQQSKIDMEHLIYGNNYSSPHKKRRHKPLPHGVILNWDEETQQAETKSRMGQHTYVISADEFFENENDWIQSSLVYYAGDGTLTTENNLPVDEHDHVLGYDFEKFFGHGSGDPRIVHIRNELLEIDYEISMDDSSFMDSGENELRHSGLRKFRTRD